MASDFIVDVSEADFEYQVLTYSQQAPVVVDFWAEWCKPCLVLGPLLENLAQEARGDFRLAKVNVDENPNLAIRYAVRSIPAVKAFRNSEMVSEFLGVQPEDRLREFLRAIAPSTYDLLLEKGLSLIDLGQPTEAETAFRQVLDNAPGNSAALLGLAKSLLLQNKAQECAAILKDFPASREYKTAKILSPLAKALAWEEMGDYENTDKPLDAAFINSLRLIKRKNIEAALDGLLDILRTDKTHRDGETRGIFVALLEILGTNNPLTKQYRNELASVLF